MVLKGLQRSQKNETRVGLMFPFGSPGAALAFPRLPRAPEASIWSFSIYVGLHLLYRLWLSYIYMYIYGIFIYVFIDHIKYPKTSSNTLKSPLSCFPPRFSFCPSSPLPRGFVVGCTVPHRTGWSNAYHNPKNSCCHRMSRPGLSSPPPPKKSIDYLCLREKVSETTPTAFWGTSSQNSQYFVWLVASKVQEYV